MVECFEINVDGRSFQFGPTSASAARLYLVIKYRLPSPRAFTTRRSSTNTTS